LLRNILIFCLAALILVNICGCVALFAGGVVGGAGTAVWLSGKLVQEVNVPLERATRAAEDALKSSGSLVLSKVYNGKDVVQIRGRDSEGEKIWVDVHVVTSLSSQIQVRVGSVFSDKAKASRILSAINSYL
jgi:hypothetical protein